MAYIALVKENLLNTPKEIKNIIIGYCGPRPQWAKTSKKEIDSLLNLGDYIDGTWNDPVITKIAVLNDTNYMHIVNTHLERGSMMTEICINTIISIAKFRLGGYVKTS